MVKILHIFPKICRVELCSELLWYHPYLVSMLFADLLSVHLATFFILVHVTRYMLELKFAIYYRTASPLTGFLCSIG